MSARKPAAVASLERSLPHNLEAEKSVLGAILTHNPGLDLINLQPSDFYRDGHRRVYEAIQALALERRAIDTLTVKVELERLGWLEDCGGPAYIASLADGVPRATNIKYYAATVQEAALLRAIIFASNRALTQAYEAEVKASDLLQETDQAFLELQQHGTRSGLVSLREGVSAFFSDLEYRHDHRDEVRGVVTGFPSIDRLTGGWQPGRMVILGARPSIGKTSFVVNTAMAAAAAGKRVAFFSFEMQRLELEYRILAHLASVDSMRLASGYTSPREQDAISQGLNALAELPIWIDDTGSQNVWDVRANCRRMKAEHGLDLVIVDYVQLIAGSLDRRGASRNDEMTEISRRLKLTAGELGVPILVLSQLNRANDKRPDPRPKLSDLRESGSLEQDADLVCFLHRKNHREGGYTEFILEKARNGPTGTANLDFRPETTTFLEWVGDVPAEAAKAPRKAKREKAEPPDDLPLNDD